MGYVKCPPALGGVLVSIIKTICSVGEYVLTVGPIGGKID